MALLNVNVGARAALLALALLVASPRIAQAETIFLKCGPMNILAVDLTNQTVDNKPANITPIAIDWINANQYGEVHLHIDRAAGTLTMSGTYFRSNGNIPIPHVAPDTCTAVSAPSTKF